MVKDKEDGKSGNNLHTQSWQERSLQGRATLVKTEKALDETPAMSD